MAVTPGNPTMTTIRLDAATADQLRRADGRVLFCDPDGRPVRSGLVFGPDPLDREPDLTPDEWRRRGEQTETYTTAQVLDALRRRGAN